MSHLIIYKTQYYVIEKTVTNMLIKRDCYIYIYVTPIFLTITSIYTFKVFFQLDLALVSFKKNVKETCDAQIPEGRSPFRQQNESEKRVFLLVNKLRWMDRSSVWMGQRTFHQSVWPPLFGRKACLQYRSMDHDKKVSYSG